MRSSGPTPSSSTHSSSTIASASPSSAHGRFSSGNDPASGPGRNGPPGSRSQAALAVFDSLGARLWSDKARAELARIGGRAPAPGSLTPTEERVAALVAAGHTYREVADELFISPKTVQWNLSKIYRKLGIRSRGELAARLAQQGGSPESAPDSDGQSPAVPPVPEQL